MKKKCTLLSIFIFSFLNPSEIAVSPTFEVRSQGKHRIRQLVGNRWNGVLQNEEQDYDWNGWFSILADYNRSFRNDTIAKCLFGSDICNKYIFVQGSNIANRSENAWVADNFYLTPDFNGAFRIKPSIQNIVFDLDFYLTMDKIAPHLYFRAHTPFNWTKWNTGFKEKSSPASSNGYVEGYFSPGSISASTLNQSICDYMTGKAPSVPNLTIYGLQFAKLGCHDETRVGFADIGLELGWNFIQDDYHHVGINIQSTLPTGNKPNAEYTFHPMIGNGKNWELGAGLTSHYVIYENRDENLSVMLYLDLSLTHMFASYKQRTYDISNRPNSRYLLVQKMSDTISNNLTADELSAVTSPSSSAVRAQFNNTYTPLANVSTAQLKIGAAVQADFVALFNINFEKFCFFGHGPYNTNITFGYNVWAKTCDQISNSRKCGSTLSIFNENNNDVWALKGTSHAFGFATANAGGLSVDDAVALSATESSAAINSIPSTSSQNRSRNIEIDSAQFAYAGTTNQRLNYATGLANIEDNHIKTSVCPEFVNFSNLNLQSTRGLSHTIFLHCDVSWKTETILNPYIGAGLSLEFGSNKSHALSSQSRETSFIDICDDECITCSASSWEIWFKGGISF